MLSELLVLPMPDYDTLYAKIKSLYKHERFEGRNDRDFPDYSHIVTRSALDDLQSRGYTMISQHESNTGEGITLNRNLERITIDWRNLY